MTIMQNPLAKPRVVFVFTLIEFIVFIAIIVCVLMAGYITHGKIDGHFGWLLGGIWGLLFFFFVGFALCILVDFGVKGFPRLPKCQNGCCRAEDYDIQEFRGGFVRISRCGGRYKRCGRRFLIVDDDGSEIPYLIWRPFRGWFSDKKRGEKGGE